MKQITNIAITAVLACLAAGCVKEPLFDTDHPNHGKIITLTTTWDGRSEGVAIPAGYTATVGDYTTTLQGTTNKIEHLFPAGQYAIHIYNVADNITVSGATATADYAAGALSWFFTGYEQAAIERDRKHAFTVPMH